MSIALKNPEYSFVTFNKVGGTEKMIDKVIPIALPTDLKFQAIVMGTEAECDALMLQIISLKAVGPTGALLINYAIAPHNLVFVKYRINLTTVLLAWPHGLPGVAALSGCIMLTTTINSVVYTSNTFKLITELGFTSVIEYSCFEDNNGFYYCADDIPNRVRLSFHLSRPQYLDEEEVYIRSGGDIDVLSSVTKKEFEGETDFMPDELHERLKIALSSDAVRVESSKYTGGIRKNGNYQIEWDDENEGEAPASFKAFATPYNVRNSNCADCE